MSDVIANTSLQDLIDRFNISARFVRFGNRLSFEFSSNNPTLSHRLAKKLHAILVQRFSPYRNHIECFLEGSGFERSVVLNPLSSATPVRIVRKLNQLFNQYFGLSRYASILQPEEIKFVFSDDEKEFRER